MLKPYRQRDLDGRSLVFDRRYEQVAVVQFDDVARQWQTDAVDFVGGRIRCAEERVVDVADLPARDPDAFVADYDEHVRVGNADSDAHGLVARILAAVRDDV